MTDEQENKIFKHIIKVDDNIEMSIKIPEYMDVMTFTAVLEKSRRLMKIGEVSIEVPFRRNERKLTVTERDKALLADYESKDSDNESLVKKYKFKNKGVLQAKIHCIRKGLGLSKSINKNRGK